MKKSPNIVFIFFITIILIVGLSIAPIPGNFKIYSVLSDSMSQTIHIGSIVFVKPVNRYKINDIVTFRTRTPKQTVTHRIAAEKVVNKQIMFISKGDANKSNDSENLLPQNIIGKVFFSVPLLGYPISFSKTLPGLIILIVIPATIIIYSELINIKNEAVRLIKKRRKSQLRKKKK